MNKLIYHFLWVLVVCISLSSLSQPAFAQEEDSGEDYLKIGGAIRFNYNLSSWKEGQRKRGGDFGYDMFRLNTRARYKGVKMDVEARYYSQYFGGFMLKRAWIGYDFNEHSEIQVGLNKVPFGALPYNSHSWFFNLPYYIGLEDDHDMGIKYSYQKDRLAYQIAFYKGAEDMRFDDYGEAFTNRYSYDVTGRNKEVNQFNGRVTYLLGEKKNTEVGLSAQYGGLYNLDSKETGNHHALAVHMNGTYGKFNVKLQALTFARNPAAGQRYNDAGELIEDQTTQGFVEMGAYGANYRVARAGQVYTASVSYTQPVEWGPVSALTFYENYNYFHKQTPERAEAIEGIYQASQMNVLGVMVTAGPVYTYIDYAMGKNQPWLGSEWTNALSKGGNDKWESRFNINVGYYF